MFNFDRSDILLGILLSPPRSGSTLLTRILDSHSRICSPCEICLPYVVYQGKKYKKSIEKLREICRYYQAPFPKLDRLLTYKVFAEKHVLRLARIICEHESKKALIIKDPRHAWYPARLEALLASVAPKYIFLYRDARGAVYSHYQLGRASLEAAFETWSEAAATMLAFQATLPSTRYIRVNYEDIVADSPQAVKRIVAFLGFQFEPVMLNYGAFEHADSQMNLWSEDNMVASANMGFIEPMIAARWQADAQLLRAYRDNASARQLNRRLGFDD